MKKKHFFYSIIGSVALSTVILLVYMHYFVNKNDMIKNIVESQINDTPVSNIAYYSPSGSIDFVQAAEKSVQSVVHIKTKLNQDYYSNPIQDFFFGNQPKHYQYIAPLASGSGVIISRDGYIVSNYHVVKDADIIEIILNDKRKYDAKVIGFDKVTDIVLLKINEINLPYIQYGNSDEIKVGQWVLAVGNPFNLTSTVTAGIVSAKARDINIMSNYGIETFIQTDAAVNPGNSGGALVNTMGELIGINTAIASNTGSYTGYSFAIPANIVQKVVADLMEYGNVQRAFIGAAIVDLNADIARYFGITRTQGVYVYNVNPKGAAAYAGIKKGDIILKINNLEIKSLPQMQEQLAKYRPNDTINILVLRDDKKMDFNLLLKDNF